MDVKTWVRGMLPLILWNKTHANLQEIKLETAIKSAWTFAYGVAWSQRSGNDSENYLPIQEGLSLTLVLAANRGKIIKIGRSEHVRLEIILWVKLNAIGKLLALWDLTGMWLTGAWDFPSLHISFRWWRGRSPGFPMYIGVFYFQTWTPHPKKNSLKWHILA